MQDVSSDFLAKAEGISFIISKTIAKTNSSLDWDPIFLILCFYVDLLLKCYHECKF